jgi:tRNA pseudouridine13 synthase
MNSFAAEIARLKVFADVAGLPYAWGGPVGTAVMRARPEDFRVTENSGLEPAGAGEHLLLKVRKTGQNTRWVAKRLAELAGVPYRAVSYAGLKDRHAVTEQWFSIHLPGQSDPQLDIAQDAGFEVLEKRRHDRKLRPGQLDHNCFVLRLSNCSVHDPAALQTRLASIGAIGAPNYFGAQRFGRDLGNLDLLDSPAGLRRLNRETRAFALSALRGALFNGYLAERVARGDWAEALDGEKLISDRPRGAAENPAGLFSNRRSPTGLLWGQNQQWSDNAAGARERAYYDCFPHTRALLEKAGCRCARRVLIAQLGGLNCALGAAEATLGFALGSGSYATMAVRELLIAEDAASDAAQPGEEA